MILNQQSIRDKQNKKAFTLIELLIVIMVIGILFIFLVSKLGGSTDKAKENGVQSDFRAYQMAFETVANEKRGFTMFGWDTGDVNGDRELNSYKEGDTNMNGWRDANETWTGNIIIAENWTGIYTLKNPANPNDTSALYELEQAINKNLDFELHIQINNDLSITTANDAKDPWGNSYVGQIVTSDSDAMDRGAIVLFSSGPNKKLNTKASISEGIVTLTNPEGSREGLDDYAVVTLYTYMNNTAEVISGFSGFGNDMSIPCIKKSTYADHDYKVQSNYSYNSQHPSDLIFTSEAPASEFVAFKIDGKEVPSSYYTVRSGSTIVTLSQSYVSNLSIGTHSFIIVSKNGSAKGNFEVYSCKGYLNEIYSSPSAQFEISVTNSYVYGWDNEEKLVHRFNINGEPGSNILVKDLSMNTIFSWDTDINGDHCLNFDGTRAYYTPINKVPFDETATYQGTVESQTLQLVFNNETITSKLFIPGEAPFIQNHTYYKKNNYEFYAKRTGDVDTTNFIIHPSGEKIAILFGSEGFILEKVNDPINDHSELKTDTKYTTFSYYDFENKEFELLSLIFGSDHSVTLEIQAGDYSESIRSESGSWSVSGICLTVSFPELDIDSLTVLIGPNGDYIELDGEYIYAEGGTLSTTYKYMAEIDGQNLYYSFYDNRFVVITDTFDNVLEYAGYDIQDNCLIVYTLNSNGEDFAPFVISPDSKSMVCLNSPDITFSLTSDPVDPFPSNSDLKMNVKYNLAIPCGGSNEFMSVTFDYNGTGLLEYSYEEGYEETTFNYITIDNSLIVTIDGNQTIMEIGPNGDYIYSETEEFFAREGGSVSHEYMYKNSHGYYTYVDDNGCGFVFDENKNITAVYSYQIKDNILYNDTGELTAIVHPDNIHLTQIDLGGLYLEEWTLTDERPDLNTDELVMDIPYTFVEYNNTTGECSSDSLTFNSDGTVTWSSLNDNSTDDFIYTLQSNYLIDYGTYLTINLKELVGIDTYGIITVCDNGKSIMITSPDGTGEKFKFYLEGGSISHEYMYYVSEFNQYMYADPSGIGVVINADGSFIGYDEYKIFKNHLFIIGNPDTRYVIDPSGQYIYAVFDDGTGTEMIVSELTDQVYHNESDLLLNTEYIGISYMDIDVTVQSLTFREDNILELRADYYGRTLTDENYLTLNYVCIGNNIIINGEVFDTSVMINGEITNNGQIITLINDIEDTHISCLATPGNAQVGEMYMLENNKAMALIVNNDGSVKHIYIPTGVEIPVSQYPWFAATDFGYIGKRTEDNYSTAYSDVYLVSHDGKTIYNPDGSVYARITDDYIDTAPFDGDLEYVGVPVDTSDVKPMNLCIKFILSQNGTVNLQGHYIDYEITHQEKGVWITKNNDIYVILNNSYDQIYLSSVDQEILSPELIFGDGSDFIMMRAGGTVQYGKRYRTYDGFDIIFEADGSSRTYLNDNHLEGFDNEPGYFIYHENWICYATPGYDYVNFVVSPDGKRIYQEDGTLVATLVE